MYLSVDISDPVLTRSVTVVDADTGETLQRVVWADDTTGHYGVLDSEYRVQERAGHIRFEFDCTTDQLPRLLWALYAVR